MHLRWSKARWIGTTMLVGWAAFLPFAGGCKESEPASSSEAATAPKELDGADIVRGMVGVAPGASGTTAAEKVYVAAANDLVEVIEADAPGRLGSIAADLRSRDAERVTKAKILLDATISAAAKSDAYAKRLAADARVSGSGVTTQALHILGGTSSGSTSGGLVGTSGGLVGDASQLLCEQPKGADGNPLHLGNANGAYGDGRTGVGAAAGDTTDLVDTTDLLIWRTLDRVDSGELTPDPDSRLGAYAATKGYAPGTVGNSVHRAIGTIYLTFANYGQEKIGRVFNAPEAKALYDQPVASCAGKQMALLEYQYWKDVQAEDAWSPGGQMGSAFNPDVRDALQQYVFNNE